MNADFEVNRQCTSYGRFMLLIAESVKTRPESERNIGTYLRSVAHQRWSLKVSSMKNLSIGTIQR